MRTYDVVVISEHFNASDMASNPVVLAAVAARLPSNAAANSW